MDKFRGNKSLDVVVIIILNFCLIVFAIWISAIPITKSKSFYMNHFEDNLKAQRLVEKLGSLDAMEDLEGIADLTINYYFGNEPTYQYYINDEVAVFNVGEVQHMKDVKDVYIVGQIIAVICFIVMIFSILYLVRNFRRIQKSIINYSLIFYGVVVILIGAFLIWGYVTYQNDQYKDYNTYFTYVFINFHYLIFPFQPDKVALAISRGPYPLDRLTTILNTQLFMDAGIIIGIVVGVVIIAWWITIICFYHNYHKIAKKVDDIHENAANS